MLGAAGGVLRHFIIFSYFMYFNAGLGTRNSLTLKKSLPGSFYSPLGIVVSKAAETWTVENAGKR